MTKNNKRLKWYERETKSAIATAIRSLVYDGYIDPQGKSVEQIVAEASQMFLNSTYEWRPVIDHTDKILGQARAFAKSGQDDLACLFYALWFEHILNKVISALAKRRKLHEHEIESLIRDTSYKAKCSWLLSILGTKPLSASHSSIISKVMELRNAFVHYKWKPKSEQLRKELYTALKQIEKTVTYIRRFEAKHLALPRRKILRAL